MLTTNRRRDQRGATAILAAMFALIIFAMAAFSVDLGNAWARKRDVQTQADLAALAGGAHLPSSYGDAATLDAVLDYLKRNEAWAGQDPSMWSTAMLTDLNRKNGEVYWKGTDELTVVTPEAEVDYAFAPVLRDPDDPEGKYERSNVQAKATVRIGSPGQMMPFFVPSNCSWGEVIVKSAAANPEPSPVFDPSGSNSRSAPKVTSVLPFEVDRGTTPTIDIFGDNFSGTTNTWVGFTRGTTNIHVKPESVSLGSTGDSLTVKLPSSVTSTSSKSVWLIRVGVDSTAPYDLASEAVWSSDNGYSELKIIDPAMDPGCGQKATGDFGLLDSPRKDTNVLLDAFALNVIQGVDHQIVKHPTPPYVDPTNPDHDTCGGLGGTPTSGSILDTADLSGQPVEGANCLNINTGAKVDTVTDGLVSGATINGTYYPGRLEKPNTAGCTDSQIVVEGKSINTDDLDCFLLNGTTATQVMQQTGAPAGALDPRIYSSPRFFWVPVLDYPYPPPAGFYAIKDFRPVFLTEFSTTNSGSGSGNKVESITVAALNPESLPKDGGSGPLISYMPGGVKVMRLVG
jgi:hypothetical protein